MLDDYSSVVDEQIKYVSAPIIYCASFLYDLIKPRSMIDFGCGPGLYSLIFMGKGCKVKAIDGCLQAGKLIPTIFESYDLQNFYKVDKKYDLVLCIEVAEHLHEQYADVLVDSLVNAGDMIFFTAAIPNQGGFCHHNEKPFQYWVEKFSKRGYIVNGNLTSIILSEFNNNSIYNSIRWIRNSAIFMRGI